MPSQIKLFIFIASFVFLALSVFPAFAQVVPITGKCGFPGAADCAAGDNIGDVKAFISSYIAVAQFIALIVAVAFLVYAGYKYITSTGNEEEAKKAKMQILYAIVGLVVVGGAEIIALAIVGAPGNQAASANALTSLIIPFINVAGFVSGIVATVFLLYAGFKYITSQGQEEQAKQAKTQIVYAIIGLAVIFFSFSIIDFLGFTGSIGSPVSLLFFSGSLTFGITGIINTLLTLIGIVATVFIIVSGVKYISSGGDEEAARTAKRQLLYAIIGLAVVFFSTAIIKFLFPTIPYPILPIASTNLSSDIVDMINDALGLIGILTTIYIIASGVKYITSSGDEEAARTAKRQLIYALIGLSIIILSVAILRFLFPLIPYPILKKTANDLEEGIYLIVNTLLTLVGIAAAIFIIVSGVKYITSSGDEEAARSAKRQLLYALVGLVIVILSSIFVNLILAPFV